MWNNWNSKKKKNVQLFIFLSNNFIYFYNNLQCVYFYNSILYQLIEMLLSSVFLCTQYKISIFKFNETTNKRNDIFSLSYYYYLISTKIFHEIIFHHSSISKIYYHQKNGAIKLKKKNSAIYLVRVKTMCYPIHIINTSSRSKFQTW